MQAKLEQSTACFIVIEETSGEGEEVGVCDVSFWLLVKTHK